MEWLILFIGIMIVSLIWENLSNKRANKSISSANILNKKLNTEKNDANSVNLSNEQEAIYRIIENTHDNIYVTGKAGTGKSLLLEYFVRHTKKTVAVVAPTGVAALNVGGVTIHSFFKFAPDVIDSKKINIDYKTREILRNIDAIVVDEVSMVRVDMMDAINAKLQMARRNDDPFGGVQMIMFGDLYQLPPVVTDGQLLRYFNHTYGGIYFFNASVFKKFPLKIYELNKIFRQKDPEFRSLLNAIRNGNNSSSILEKINTRVNIELPDSGFVTLAGTNLIVSDINHKKLSELPGEEQTYVAQIEGNLLESSFPTEKYLKLKLGAQIMMLKNDTAKPRRWVNGTLGVISSLSDDSIKVNIDGVEHSILKETWSKYTYSYDHEKRKLEKEVVSSFTQFPLRLAWAITIHKSQGQTYESVAVDMRDGAFAHGQAYVALSRCKSFNGLYITTKIRPEDIIIDQEIIEFMKKAKIITT